MTSLRDRIDGVMAQVAVTIACSMCTRPWQRPAGMADKRCPSCAARRGTPYRSPGEQLATDVTRYRLAIEQATQALRSGMPDAALRVLLTVEAPGRSVQGGSIIGPPLSRQGSPDKPAQPEVPPVAPPAQVEVKPYELVEDDDPIALVQNLALGAYKPAEKRGTHGRRSR